ncbi:phage minor head protein [Shouchella clausii]|uniref:phage minor head protein n=1 Tax=Shouchella clausii TaxID=79880 RepID=UPI0015C76A77|nr:phage minor head protein [Shouchella clausii]
MPKIKKEFQQLHSSIETLVAKQEKSQAIDYANALKDIKGALANLYEHYEVDGQISWLELTQYNLLTEFQDEITAKVLSLNETVSNDIVRFLGDVFNIATTEAANAFQKETNRVLSSSAVRIEVLEKSVQNPMSGLTLNERFEKKRTKVVFKMKEEITQGLYRNETYATMAKRVTEVLEGDAYKAETIVRTEAHRVREEAVYQQASAFKDDGIVLTKTWNTVGDERVRPQHVKMDGKTIPVDEDFVMPDGTKGPGPGMMGAPQHDIRDRCFLTYEVVDIQEPGTVNKNSSIELPNGTEAQTNTSKTQAPEPKQPIKIEDRFTRVK